MFLCQKKIKIFFFYINSFKLLFMIYKIRDFFTFHFTRHFYISSWDIVEKINWKGYVFVKKGHGGPEALFRNSSQKGY